jgi:3D (Asp-Asp-Asp) domain-containing protein
MSRITFASGTVLCALTLGGCAWGSGKEWVQAPLPEEGSSSGGSSGSGGRPSSGGGRPASRTIAGKQASSEDEPQQRRAAVTGDVLGVFRNTYYDFPSEKDFSGDRVPLMSASCSKIADVPRAFHDAVCVQGSGKLAAGATVSFAKRDCPCALTCTRTGQKICFEPLDAARFPYGRGASGQPIRPLVTVAADTSVLPLGTVIYVKEFDGLVLPGDSAPHDGCFVVEDRGSAVKGEHVDIFTGSPDVTRVVNQRLPSNQGVTVVRGVQKCERLKGA